MPTSRNPRIILSLFALTTVAACSTTPQSPGEITSTILVQDVQSWDGGNYAYPEGEAQLTVARILMPKGSALPMHCHPVPLAGEVVRGPLVVHKEDGESITLQSGSGLIEVSRQWHYGTAMEDVEILVVYAGASDVPITVFKDGDPKWVSQCQ